MDTRKKKREQNNIFLEENNEMYVKAGNNIKNYTLSCLPKKAQMKVKAHNGMNIYLGKSFFMVKKSEEGKKRQL